jgi:hypothetical protein
LACTQSVEIKPIFGPSGVSIVQSRHNENSVRHLTSNPALSLDRPPGPNAEILLLWVISDKWIGLIQKLRQLARSKKELITEDKVLALIKSIGVNTSLSRHSFFHEWYLPYEQVLHQIEHIIAHQLFYPTIASDQYHQFCFLVY